MQVALLAMRTRNVIGAFLDPSIVTVIHPLGQLWETRETRDIMFQRSRNIEGTCNSDRVTCSVGTCVASHRNMFVPFCLNTRQLKSAALPSTVLSEVCNCILRNICAETQL